MSSEVASLNANRLVRPESVKNIIAIASGKGGVGKTFVATTLAYALSLSGKNVLLFDGDLGLANVDVQLGLMPKYDLGSVIAGRVSLEQAVCTFGQNDNDGKGATRGHFDILAGKSGSGALNTLGMPQLKGLIRGLTDLALTYDYVLVDLPAGIDSSVTLFSTLSAVIFVVLTDEPTSLTDAYAYIKVVARQDPKANFQIIVNQATRKSDGERTFGSIAHACRNFLSLELDFAGTVRRDAKVKDAIRHQMPILRRSPDANASHDISNIAKTLL